MKCYRKNGSDGRDDGVERLPRIPSMKCYRKNGSDWYAGLLHIARERGPQ